MADTFVIIGASPILFVVTEANVFELGEVHAVPDNALNRNVYAVPVVNPVIMNGLVVPDASENVIPSSVEYWYLVNAGYPPVESVKVTRIEVVEPSIADTFIIVGESPALFVVTDDDADELGEVQA